MTSSHRKKTFIAGLLFLAAIFAYGFGSALTALTPGNPDELAQLPAHGAQHASGALLMLLNSVVVAGIGILLYPVLKPSHPTTALVYLVARVTEAVVLAVGILFLLLLLPLSQQCLAANASDLSFCKTLSQLLVQGNYWSYQTAMLILGIGSVLFCIALFRSGLLPKWAAVWGILGYALLGIDALCEFYGRHLGFVLGIPGGLFEVFLAVWLMVKGFRNVR